MPLHDVLTLKTIRTLAGEKSFTRGLAYFHDGAVGLLRERKGVLAADVSGSYLYHVTLSESLDGGLDYDCTCPVGQDGDFCKHAVAVALSWLENHGEESFPPEESPKPRKKRKTQADTLAEYLDTLPEAQIKEWLLEAARRDRGLRDTLLMKARAAGSGKQGASGLAALRGAVLKAARQSGFLDWRQAGDFARRLYDAAELIQARVPLGEPCLPGVIEEVIREAVSSLENVDDSNGAVQEALHHLGAVHLAACLASRPDAVELAKRLFVTESESEWDFYPATIPHYLDVLGDEGLQHYRKLVLKAAESVPVKTRHVVNASGYNRYTIERLLERLCTHDKNDTPLLHFLEKSLESPFDYLKLAERHLAGGRSQLALEWAERGLQKFPDLHDRRLTDFCIEQLRKHGQSARADELAWAQFSHNPGHEGWQHLLVMTPEPQREETSQRAIAHLEHLMQQEENAPPKATRKSYWAQPSARSELVRIHLQLKNAGQVWALAKGHSLDTRLWPAVAKLRGETHPEEAILIYKKLLPDAIRQGQSNARYAEAHELLTRIRALRIQQGKQAEFNQEIAALRLEYKAKRNFIKRLDSLSS